MAAYDDFLRQHLVLASRGMDRRSNGESPYPVAMPQANSSPSQTNYEANLATLIADANRQLGGASIDYSVPMYPAEVMPTPTVNGAIPGVNPNPTINQNGTVSSQVPVRTYPGQRSDPRSAGTFEDGSSLDPNPVSFTPPTSSRPPMNSIQRAAAVALARMKGIT